MPIEYSNYKKTVCADYKLKGEELVHHRLGLLTLGEWSGKFSRQNNDKIFGDKSRPKKGGKYLISLKARARHPTIFVPSNLLAESAPQSPSFISPSIACLKFLSQFLPPI